MSVMIQESPEVSQQQERVVNDFNINVATANGSGQYATAAAALPAELKKLNRVSHEHETILQLGLSGGIEIPDDLDPCRGHRRFGNLLYRQAEGAPMVGYENQHGRFVGGSHILAKRGSRPISSTGEKCRGCRRAR